MAAIGFVYREGNFQIHKINSEIDSKIYLTGVRLESDDLKPELDHARVHSVIYHSWPLEWTCDLDIYFSDAKIKTKMSMTFEKKSSN